MITQHTSIFTCVRMCFKLLSSKLNLINEWNFMITENKSLIIFFQSDWITVTIYSVSFYWLAHSSSFDCQLIYSAKPIGFRWVFVFITYFFYHTQLNIINKVYGWILWALTLNYFLVKLYLDIWYFRRWLCGSGLVDGVESEICFASGYDQFRMGVIVYITLFTFLSFSPTCILRTTYLWRFTICFNLIILTFMSCYYFMHALCYIIWL